MLALDQAATTIANTAAAIAAAELKLDPVVVEQTTTLLKRAEEKLRETTFPYMGTIQSQSFGTTHAGVGLSAEHRLAHEVMEKTIEGVAKDVNDFCANLLAAVKLIETTDEAAAADIQQRQEWLERTQYGAQHSQGEEAYENAQQEVHSQPPAGDA